MHLRLLVWLIAAAVGFGVVTGAGYLIVRGPFLGGPLLDPVPLMIATGAFVAGIVGFTFGATKAVRALTTGR